jgi:hypothetical protein
MGEFGMDEGGEEGEQKEKKWDIYVPAPVKGLTLSQTFFFLFIHRQCVKR